MSRVVTATGRKKHQGVQKKLNKPNLGGKFLVKHSQKFQGKRSHVSNEMKSEKLAELQQEGREKEVHRLGGSSTSGIVVTICD